MDKSDSAYKTIGEVAKILNLKSNKKGELPTHIIRFWESQFKQIKPKILNSNRRYYDEKNIDLLRKIKYLLKLSFPKSYYMRWKFTLLIGF